VFVVLWFMGGLAQLADSKGAWSLVNSTFTTPQHVITFRMCTRGDGRSRVTRGDSYCMLFAWMLYCRLRNDKIMLWECTDLYDPHRIAGSLLLVGSKTVFHAVHHYRWLPYCLVVLQLHPASMIAAKATSSAFMPSLSWGRLKIMILLTWHNNLIMCSAMSLALPKFQSSSRKVVLSP